MTTALLQQEEATSGAAVGALLDRRVRPVPADYVYRVQDAEGRGPFRPGFSHRWVEERPDHDNLVPWMQQFGHDALQHTGWPFGKHFGCACRTLEQLRRWFTAGEYATLERFGFQAVRLDVARVLHESEIQLLFQRAKPLRADASPVVLYGPNDQHKRVAGQFRQSDLMRCYAILIVGRLYSSEGKFIPCAVKPPSLQGREQSRM